MLRTSRLKYTKINHVLYEPATLSREEHRLSVFKNRMLRRIFGPKKKEFARSWRRQHNEKIHRILFG
jgi:hypothetical protein